MRRTIILCTMFVAASFDFLIKGSGMSLHQRARWLHRWSRRCAHLIGMRFEKAGVAPQTGLIVANHLSYLDIIALSATTPSIFVAKNDVSRWPIFGTFARMAGTIFIDRTRRTHVTRTTAQMKTALETGLPVVVFPEGTSSDGRAVLPFKSSLFQPACECAVPITPVAVDYNIAKVSVSDVVCYWGEMTLIPHLAKLLTMRKISVYLSFGSPVPPDSDRKALATRLRLEIVRLRNFSGECSLAPASALLTQTHSQASSYF